MQNHYPGSSSDDFNPLSSSFGSSLREYDASTWSPTSSSMQHTPPIITNNGSESHNHHTTIHSYSNTQPPTNIPPFIMSSNHHPAQHHNNPPMNMNYFMMNHTNHHPPLFLTAAALPSSTIVPTAYDEYSMIIPTATPTNISSSSPLSSEAQFFAIACEPCRKQHRKCSKHLPSCMECKQRGVECVYRESKRIKSSSSSSSVEEKHSKRNTKEHSTSVKDKKLKYKPYEKASTESSDKRGNDVVGQNENLNSTEFDEETGHLNKRNVIEFYYEFASDGCPCIAREEFEKFLFSSPSLSSFDSSNSSNSSEELNDSNSVEREAWLAIFLSIRALCECRYGLTELAEKSAQKAKNLLSKMFDQFNNYHVAVVYGNLATYEAWCGRFENAKFYVQILSYCVNSLFPDATKREQMNIYERNLESVVFYFNRIISDNFEKMGIQQVVQRIPEVFSFFTGKQCPSNWLKLLQQEITSENCFEIWSVIQVIIEDLKQAVIANVNSPSTKQIIPACYGYRKEYSSMIEPVFTLFSHSVKISILAKSSSPLVRGVIEKCALEITQITEHEAFPLFPVEVVACVIAASQIHIQIVKMLLQQDSADFMYNGNNYFEILQKDLRGIDILRKRYKILSKFSNLIGEIEDCVSLIKAKIALGLERDVIYPQHGVMEEQTSYQPTMATQSGGGDLLVPEQNFLLFEDIISANLLSSDDLNHVFDFE
ncbi:hypothetical protein C9374_010387 [Naegleria lovaniensis]|uniref:Zn(2)-C6 fungal-type domain-containing protein n=1 Tax=Naegleria lovaniensis TaxID=51637 RepID=A0AA88GHL2_NAELO|nr:uncharacterized protein C9374_010387 [Naegleria lovaniensis]KAG2375013.1 hypothetical protein C9374_010387 [Naegleria lovaniensis]